MRCTSWEHYRTTKLKIVNPWIGIKAVERAVVIIGHILRNRNKNVIVVLKITVKNLENSEAKRQETFKLLERKGFPLRILYPFKLLIKCEAVIKTISDRQSTLRITVYHKKTEGHASATLSNK